MTDTLRDLVAKLDDAFALPGSYGTLALARRAWADVKAALCDTQQAQPLCNECGGAQPDGRVHPYCLPVAKQAQPGCGWRKDDVLCCLPHRHEGRHRYQQPVSDTQDDALCANDRCRHKKRWHAKGGCSKDSNREPQFPCPCQAFEENKS